MYELNGTEYSLKQLQSAAQRYDMDFDSYLDKMKTKGLVEKTSDVAAQGAPVASGKNTASSSGTTSSVSQPESKYRLATDESEPPTQEELLEQQTRKNTIYVKNDKLMTKEEFEDSEERQQQLPQTINKLDLALDNYYQDLKKTYNQAVADYGGMSQAAADALKAMQDYEKRNLEITQDPVRYERSLEYDTRKENIKESDKKLDQIHDRYVQFYLDQGFSEVQAIEMANEKRQNAKSLEAGILKKNRYDQEEVINKGKDNLTTVTQSDDLTTMSWDDNDAESIEITDEIEKEIYLQIGLEGFDRAAQDDEFILSLSEKENIITAAKSKVLEQKYTTYEGLTNTLQSQAEALQKDFSAFDTQQKELKRQLDLLGDVNENSSQEDIIAYNNLVNQNNQLTQSYEQLKNREQVILKEYDKANDYLGKVYTELGYDAVKQAFNSNFEVTDKIQEYKDRFIKKSLETDSWWKKKGYESWDAIATFANESSQMISKSSVGLGGFLGYQVTRLYRDDTEYFDSNEFLLEAFSKPGEVELFAESEIGADISNKLYDPENKSTFEQIIDTDAYNVNFRNSTKMIGKMLPFTLGIMYSGGAQSVVQGTTMYTRGANLLKKFSYVGKNSTQIKQGIRMLDATYRMTITDNYTDGVNQGLDNNQALAYANAMSFATGLSQMIMPDRNFFKTPAGQGVLNNFVGSLKKAATVEARKKVFKQFTVNIAKELGEEQVEMAMQDIAKLATLENFHSEFLDAEAQRNVIVGTLLLSGSLGTVAAKKNYKNAKKVIYKQYENNADEIIKTIELDEKLAKEHRDKVFKDKRYNQKSKDAAQANYDQVIDTKTHAFEIRNAIKSAPEAVTAEQIDVLVQKQKLVNKKQNIDKAFHAGIDSKIKGLDEVIQNSEVVKKREEILDKTTKNVNKISGNQVVNFNTTEELKQKLLEEGYSEEDADYNSRQEGFFNSKTGQMYMNRAVSLSGGSSNVAAHEYLHKMLAATVNADKNVALKIGQSLGSFLMDLDPNQFTNSSFVRKLALYQTNQGDVNRIVRQYGKFDKDGNLTNEDEIDGLIQEQIGLDIHKQAIEVLTLAADAMATGDLTFEITSSTKIKDFLRRAGQGVKGTAIKFDTAEDIFNFLRDYNTSVKKGKLTKAQQALVDGAKIEGALTEVENEIQTESTVGQQESRSQASAAVQEIYNERGSEGIFDIIEAFKPITNRLARKYSEVPGYDEELLMTEIELSQRGLYGLVNDYDPQSGVPLAAYINKYLPARAIESARKILKENFEADITEARGVAAEETAEDAIAEPERKTSLIDVADNLNISSQAAETVTNANIDPITLTSFKNVPNAVSDIVGGLLGISSKKIKSKANLTAAEVASAQRWFNKNAALMIQVLPQGFNSEGKATGIPKTILDTFYNKRSSRAKTKAGLKTQVKRTNILDSELLALVGIIDGTPTRDRNTSARIIALADLLGKVITNQELRKQNPQLATISDGMSPVLFSKSWNTLADTHEYSRLNFTKDTDRNEMIKWTTQVGSKEMPKSFWLMQLTGSGAKFDDVKDANGKKIDKKYYLNDSTTILKSDPNFEESRLKHLPASNKHLFANKAQFNEQFKNVEFAEETDVLKAISSRKLYGKQNNDWAQDFWKKQKNQDFLNNSEIGFSQTWLVIQESVKDKNNKKFWAAALESTPVNQKNFVRINSKYGFHNTLGLVNREEHAQPATEHAQMLWDLANMGVLDAGMLQQMNENFVQGALPKIFDDLLGEYADKIPQEYYHDVLFGIMPYWVRYINPVVNKKEYKLNGKTYYGINPNVITLSDGRTLAETFNVGVDKSLHMTQDIISMQQELLFQVFTNEMTTADAKGRMQKYLDSYIVRPETKRSKTLKDASNAYLYQSRSAKSRGMSTFDFDETLIIDGENFIIATNPETKEQIRISSGQWPIQGPRYQKLGYDFDFTDFVNVRGGVDGPLLQKMKNQIKKYGTKNVFVLTARPQESATAIHEWLKTKGVNIPLKNITGLANSTGDAKAAWFLEKYAEGYNDMYFVDDALPNVKAVKHVFDQLDIKGKSVQARINFSKTMSTEFNEMLERTKGVGAEKIFSLVEGRKRGKNVGGFTLFVPPSAEDFTGLLRYFVGKGEQGNADIKFFEEALIKPFARADREMSSMKQGIRDQYRVLRKQLPNVRKKLGKLSPVKGFTFDGAIRVYLFNKAGYEIPGLAKNAQQELIRLVQSDPELRAFADGVGAISKRTEGYIKPEEGWDMGNIAADLQSVTDKISRKQFLQEWVENKDMIFSPENLNKIEATYGTNFRSALEDILYRMETGQNRRKGRTKFENQWNNWINSSVGAIMFFNARSAVLQTLSTVNFINFEDNNIFAAGKAFANQKQYWSDFSFLFNSDFLRNRRAGLATNVNEAELASAVAGAKNKATAALRYLLKIGFTPTQVADSFAIASGGATFYRNRVKKYIKEGRSQQEAEDQAMLDFREIAEETQQSARPDRISQQQASNLGRIILAFANTPMQYNRLIKKAAGDFLNKRGDWRSNISRIVYYGAVQNFIFASLQNALFALAFDDSEEDDERKEVKEQRILNSMLDSLLRGSGIAGAVLATVKNALIEYADQDAKGWRADYGQVIIEALQVSPPLGSKARKLFQASQVRKFNQGLFSRMDLLDYDNPTWEAMGYVVEATTNIPMARGIRKIDNLREAMNQENTNLQRLMLTLGWSSWDLGVGEKVIRNEGQKDEYTVTLDTKRMAREEVKQEIAEEKKQVTIKKREQRELEKEKEKEVLEQENLKKQKKEGKEATCAAITSSGNRCKRKPGPSGYCTVHEKVEKRSDGKEVQCSHIKSNKKRCKMKTTNKSGLCYYHD